MVEFFMQEIYQAGFCLVSLLRVWMVEFVHVLIPHVSWVVALTACFGKLRWYLQLDFDYHLQTTGNCPWWPLQHGGLEHADSLLRGHVSAWRRVSIRGPTMPGVNVKLWRWTQLEKLILSFPMSSPSSRVALSQKALSQQVLPGPLRFRWKPLVPSSTAWFIFLFYSQFIGGDHLNFKLHSHNPLFKHQLSHQLQTSNSESNQESGVLLVDHDSYWTYSHSSYLDVHPHGS